LDLDDALRRFSRTKQAPTARWLSEDVVGAAERPGAGLFTQALQKELAARRLDVPFVEHRLPPSDH
jgi:hypothetical protein